MSSKYKIMLIDELDFSHRINESRENVIKSIADAIIVLSPRAEIIADFYQHLVIDIDKTYPYSKEMAVALHGYCDWIFAWADDTVWDKKELSITASPDDTP